jgi:shikimate kinase
MKHDVSDYDEKEQLTKLRTALGGRSLVLVGLMGAGKSTIGKRLAARLGLLFRDSDNEIEIAAGMPIADIFDLHGEMAFRDVEIKVIARLLHDTQGLMVIATGGGAFMKHETRDVIKQCAVSIWLDAEWEILMARVRKRASRPLLNGPDPEGVMRRLKDLRDPIYATADIRIVSRDAPHEEIVDNVLTSIQEWLVKRGDWKEKDDETPSG